MLLVRFAQGFIEEKKIEYIRNLCIFVVCLILIYLFVVFCILFFVSLFLFCVCLCLYVCFYQSQYKTLICFFLKQFSIYLLNIL